MQNEPVLLRDDRAGVACLTLNRPKAFNSLSNEVLDRLEAELDRIATDPEVRVVVLAGVGPAFSAGHDLKEIAADRSHDAIEALFAHCSRVMVKLSRLPQPVIAVVDGIAAAAGCQLVAACDLAIASDTSRFATSGIKFGLFCATPAVALRRAVPQKAALEMLFTGEFIDAQEALRLGLVNRVAPSAELDATLGGLTASLIEKPAAVLAMGKRAFYEEAGMGLEESYRHATGVIVANALTDEFAEGLAAFQEKRKPSWPAGRSDR